MKKLIGLIFTLLVCGLVAPHRVVDGGAERSVSEVACAVAAAVDSSTAHHALAAGEDGSLALQRLLDGVAIVVPSADMAAGKTSAKTVCCKWCRGCNGRLHGHSRRGCEEAAMSTRWWRLSPEPLTTMSMPSGISSFSIRIVSVVSVCTLGGCARLWR